MSSRSVVLLARGGARLDTLKAAAERLGLITHTTEELEPVETIAEWLARVADPSRLVLVVWDTPRLPSAVMFEAGYVLGRGARVALLDARPGSPKSGSLLVDTLLQVPRLNARLSDLEGLVQELSAVLSISNFAAKVPKAPRFEGAEVGLVSAGGGESRFEERVVELLTNRGFRVTPSRMTSRDVPDFQAWVPDFFSPFNPVLVELAGRRADLPRKRDLLRAAMRSQRAHLAVLVTADKSPSGLVVDEETAICTVSLDQLEASPDDLTLILRTARNRLVHGVR